MYKLSDLLIKQFPPESSLIGSGLLKKDSILIIGGPAKSMKSIISLNIATSLATATPVFGTLPVSPIAQRVLYIEQEIGYEDDKLRFQGIWSNLPYHLQELASANIWVESCNRDLRLDTTYGTKLLSDLISSCQPNVVIFDPLIEFHSSAENDTTAMSGVFRHLDHLRTVHNFATIINHHRTKLSNNPDVLNDDSPETLRGSSYVFGKVDSVMMLRPGTSGSSHSLVTCNFTIRRGKPIPSLKLQIGWDNLVATYEGMNKDNSLISIPISGSVN